MKNRQLKDVEKKLRKKRLIQKLRPRAPTTRRTKTKIGFYYFIN